MKKNLTLSQVRVEGIVEEDVLLSLKERKLQNFLFDFRVTSPQFLQLHLFCQWIEAGHFLLSDKLFFLFSHENPLTIFKIVSDIKEAFEHNLGEMPESCLEFRPSFRGDIEGISLPRVQEIQYLQELKKEEFSGVYLHKDFYLSDSLSLKLGEFIKKGGAAFCEYMPGILFDEKVTYSISLEGDLLQSFRKTDLNKLHALLDSIVGGGRENLTSGERHANTYHQR